MCDLVYLSLWVLQTYIHTYRHTATTRGPIGPKNLINIASCHLWTEMGQGRSAEPELDILGVSSLDLALGLLWVAHPAAQPGVLRHQDDLLQLRVSRGLLPQGGGDQRDHHRPVSRQLCLCQVWCLQIFQRFGRNKFLLTEQEIQPSATTASALAGMWPRPAHSSTLLAVKILLNFCHIFSSHLFSATAAPSSTAASASLSSIIYSSTWAPISSSTWAPISSTRGSPTSPMMLSSKSGKFSLTIFFFWGGGYIEILDKTLYNQNHAFY